MSAYPHVALHAPHAPYVRSSGLHSAQLPPQSTPVFRVRCIVLATSSNAF